MFICACQLPEFRAEPIFHQKRVLFLGNSITHNGTYVSVLEYFVKRQHPEWEVDIISIGLGSETVSCLTEPDHPFPRPCLEERLERALDKVQPDVMFACYGMNDGIYHPWSAERQQAYQQGIQDLVGRCQERSIKLVLITPPPFEAQPIQDRLVGPEASEFGYKYPFEDYDQVLQRYSDWLLGLASEELWVIDWHDTINDHMQTIREKDPAFTFTRDGIHPSPAGHFFMARVLADYLGVYSFPELSWESFSAQEDYQTVAKDRAERSEAWLKYVGYTRGETVRSDVKPE
jgi:lysophospholipase L1-like esterase